MYKEKHLKRSKRNILFEKVTNLFPNFGEIFFKLGANLIEWIDQTIEEFGQNIRF